MILVLNCGSLSIKYKLFDDDFHLIKEKNESVKDQRYFMKILERTLKELESSKNVIEKIGHRVVHGGEKFREPLKITKKHLKELEKYNKLAPLHNPFNISGIRATKKLFPKAEQIAVFDTGFYKDLPKVAYLYPLPEKIRKEYGFRRYGFHGISHEYVSKKAAEYLNENFNELKIISCHLGGGSSICAIKNGKAIDTSMGFTPLEGLMMMSRSGDIDPGIVLELCKNFPADRVGEILNKESGINGICDEKSMLKVLKRKDKNAESALAMFVYRIKKYIGAYWAVLNGCDVLIFTGSIGFGSQKIRNMISGGLAFLKNTKILHIETNEELAIAQKSQKL